MSLSAKKRNAILERDGWVCVACGTLTMLTIHHRINRGMGGSALVDSPAHLLSICNPCNVAFESNADRAEQARAYGYKLAKNAKPPIDPTSVPVKYAMDGNWYLLDNLGNRKITNGK